MTTICTEIGVKNIIISCCHEKQYCLQVFVEKALDGEEYMWFGNFYEVLRDMFPNDVPMLEYHEGQQNQENDTNQQLWVLKILYYRELKKQNYLLTVTVQSMKIMLQWMKK